MIIRPSQAPPIEAFDIIDSRIAETIAPVLRIQLWSYALASYNEDSEELRNITSAKR